jgi:hypothetical protein
MKITVPVQITNINAFNPHALKIEVEGDIPISQRADPGRLDANGQPIDRETHFYAFRTQFLAEHTKANIAELHIGAKLNITIETEH